MKNMKKLLSAFLLLGALVSCGGNTSSTPEGSVPAQVENKTELDASLVGIAANKTVHLTTVGQADSNIVSNVLNKAGATGEYTINTKLTAAEVGAGDVVFLTLGSSSKGLGDAGVDEASEKARAQAFSAAAKAGNFTLILFHVGGTARRGTSSDPIIEAAFPGAKACFVVAAGNEDGFFTTLAGTNNVDLYSVAKTLDIVTFAKGLYGKE